MRRFSCGKRLYSTGGTPLLTLWRQRTWGVLYAPFRASEATRPRLWASAGLKPGIRPPSPWPSSWSSPKRSTRRRSRRLRGREFLGPKKGSALGMCQRDTQRWFDCPEVVHKKRAKVLYSCLKVVCCGCPIFPLLVVLNVAFSADLR